MSNIKKPNVIILYADDLGYGDVSAYGSEQIPTPNIDRLANEGLKFNQGYATAATCTPSRYSLLTGSYPWRNPDASILRGDAAMIVPQNGHTLPAMFQKSGYKTGIVGKWHLGLADGNIDWNSTNIQGTPNDVGFDESYIMAATNDRVPCVYIDNRKVDNLNLDDPLEVTYERSKAFPDVPTPATHPELSKIKGHGGAIIKGIPRIGYMRGGESALWDDETMSDVFLDKAIDFVERNSAEPFFLYYAFHQPHAPRIPSAPFAGKSKLGPRGDVILELDWCVGQLLDKLETLSIAEDTIVIFSSDNGPVLWDVYQDNSIELANGHSPAGPLRGGKYSSYDGGTRVPFLVKYPREIEKGETDALLCHTDFYASFAKMLGYELNEDEAPDSFALLDTLFGKTQKGRTSLVVEGNRHNTILRHENWTYIPSCEGPEKSYNGIEFGNSSEPQLYDLNLDIGQIENEATKKKDILAQLTQNLDAILSSQKTRVKV